jgi:uncharacterized membrane protein YdbT with pleckstrin-like domain
MGSYVQANLGKDETVLCSAHFTYAKDILLMFIGIGFFTIWVTLFRNWTTEMVVTNKRIIIKTGFISRRTFDNRLTKIEGVEVDQGVFGRMLGYGTVTVRGTGNAVQSLPYIAKPINFKNAFNEACDSIESK